MLRNIMSGWVTVTMAGDISVYLNSESGVLGGKVYFEIVGFGSLEKLRRLGIGFPLMNVAKSKASKYGRYGISWR